MIAGSPSSLLDSLAHEVHVWLLPDACELPANCEGWLTADERQRWRRYRLPADRERYLRGKTLQRTALSRYLPIAPPDWRFRIESQGRPVISSPATGTDLRFSLSHTTGLTALAVASDREVGIDVEYVNRQVPDSLARFALSPAELAERAQLQAARDQDPFFEFWTLKEAFLKARGSGFSVAPATLSFTLMTREEPTLMRSVEAWQFAQLKPSPAHQLALAIGPDRAGAFKRLTVHVRHFMQLADDYLATEAA
ncbi:4'-phosphopantetheinyl transferase sfp [Anatilimnocola aggregata]|uniref:4'-phosphopantetheinyl transferase sfp n=1 Tax=Anatilimnocola aggregata TaxID=2528021 RepID=A0A517YCQ6_9BACT|nr:4'-phosphopantetheinyl transferase superfamily protein [Anatilimnocola aggregata]QDU28025.1 4'-phosphopantetheinyl transferase sfp [Anatilimnocola aggregata]